MSRMQTDVADKLLIDSDAYMHAYTRCKAKHHPLFICSLCNPIEFFIGFINPISAPLEVLVWFYFFIEITVYLNGAGTSSKASTFRSSRDYSN